jgi:hypothetical protein
MTPPRPPRSKPPAVNPGGEYIPGSGNPSSQAGLLPAGCLPILRRSHPGMRVGALMVWRFVQRLTSLLRAVSPVGKT